MKDCRNCKHHIEDGVDCIEDFGGISYEKLEEILNEKGIEASYTILPKMCGFYRTKEM